MSDPNDNNDENLTWDPTWGSNGLHDHRALMSDSPEETRFRQVEAYVGGMLAALGENVDRPGLQDTPKRVAKMYISEMFAGLGADLNSLIDKAVFPDGGDEMVIVSDIWFYSFCEHHLVPFFGKAHVGYIPTDGNVVGLSKIARVVDLAARKPQVQERLGSEIANALFTSERLKPEGVGVVVQAEHLCMAMRGIQKPGAVTTTSHMLGSFRDEPETRAEFLSLIPT